jgi:hypothetical protein
MSAKPASDTYTMPLKQLLKLLETTADETPRQTRRRGTGKSDSSRRRHDRHAPDSTDEIESEYGHV